MEHISVNTNKTRSLYGLVIGLAVVVTLVGYDATAVQAPVPLGSTATFGVLAGSTVTSTGASTVNGDLGVSPGTTLTGAPAVNGTTHLADPAAAQAQLDLTTAFNDAAGRTVGAVTVAGNLGGQTLAPGLYTSATSLEISSGDLTLDAQGDTNAVFIFQMGSTLTTTAGRQVILSGGAQAGNIYWQVGSSATLGTTSVFKGKHPGFDGHRAADGCYAGRQGVGAEWRGYAGRRHDCSPKHSTSRRHTGISVRARWFVHGRGRAVIESRDQDHNGSDVR